MAPRPVKILLVEDNPGDVDLTRESLDEIKLSYELQVASNGEEALRFLRRQGEHADAARPDLVLLDLNLPRLSGREVLAEVKGDPVLRRIPVVVLSSSRSAEDIALCYELHANCYITKPVGLEQFIDVMLSIKRFWLSVVTLSPE